MWETTDFPAYDCMDPNWKIVRDSALNLSTRAQCGAFPSERRTVVGDAIAYKDFRKALAEPLPVPNK
jgi:hypothetical protein